MAASKGKRRTIGETLEQITPEYLEERARRITPVELSRVVDHAKDLDRRFARAAPLKPHREDARLLLGLLSDFHQGSFRAASYRSIATIVTALGYALHGDDLIDDKMPFVGALDDAAVFALCLDLVKRDLDAYRKWKKRAAKT